MLIDRTDGKLDKVREFAERTGQTKSLQENLDYLGSYACNSGRQTRCLLYPDFAPESFFFRMELKQENEPDTEYKPWFVGGCIYFGTHDTGVGAPQFSVRLDTGKSGWSIHT